MSEHAPGTPITHDFNQAIGKRLLDGRARLQDTDTDQENHRRAVRALLNNMYEVSGDPSGSDPEDYFDEGDVATLKSFNAIMKHLYPGGWPVKGDMTTHDLSMRVGWLGQKHIWTRRDRSAKSGTFNLTRTRKLGAGRLGIKFAQLGTSPTQQVALGEDGKLYSERDPGALNKSKGLGWGRLPDPDLTRAALSRGHGMFDLYGRGSGIGSLANSLMLTLPQEDIREARKIIEEHASTGSGQT